MYPADSFLAFSRQCQLINLQVPAPTRSDPEKYEAVYYLCLGVLLKETLTYLGLPLR